MRLLNVKTLTLEDFPADPPPYAIASHRWGNHEATYEDFQKQRQAEKSTFRRAFGRKKTPEPELPGTRKVKGFCRLVRRMNREYADCPEYQCEWLWIDTCCINKASSTELQEAINSMFAWYANALVCYVYMADIELAQPKPNRQSARFALKQELSSSSWFTRGWTLQELLAPATVVFLDKRWQVTGHKCAADAEPSLITQSAHTTLGPSLNQDIEQITGIPCTVLQDYNSSRDLSIEAKMAWLKGRKTTRVEDMAYCTLGLFNVFATMIYGEGRQAMNRILREIDERTKRGDPQPELPRHAYPCMIFCMQDPERPAPQHRSRDSDRPVSKNAVTSAIAYAKLDSQAPQSDVPMSANRKDNHVSRASYACETTMGEASIEKESSVEAEGNERARHQKRDRQIERENKKTSPDLDAIRELYDIPKIAVATWSKPRDLPNPRRSKRERPVRIKVRYPAPPS